MKLYGGAQYERLLRETEGALMTLELPVPSEDEVCISMGIHSIGGMLNGSERVINVVVKTKAYETLEPILIVLNKRIIHIFERLFDIALQIMQKVYKDQDLMKNEEISNTLKELYKKFLLEKLKEVEKMLKDDIHSFVSVIDWDLLISNPVEDEKEEEMDEKERQQFLKEKVEKMMEEKSKNELKIIQQLRNINGSNSHKEICSICQNVFKGIRESFWRNCRSKLNAYFLQPMIGEIKEELLKELNTLNSLLFDKK